MQHAATHAGFGARYLPEAPADRAPARRWVLVLVLLAMWIGSLAWIGGWGWYLRSDGYRLACARRLSESLGLQAEIGRVVPRSMQSRQFEDVVVWLPQRRGRAATCRQALLVMTPTREDPDAYELQLTGGACEISTRTWLRQDYRGVLTSGLQVGFMEGGPRRVHLRSMDLLFERDGFDVALRGAVGEVSFLSPTLGRAHLLGHELNGHACAEPVFVSVEFSPRQSGVSIDDLALKIPRLPLEVAGFHELVGLDRPAGQFGGSLRYRESDGHRSSLLTGLCADLDISQWTAGLLPRPVRGQAPEVELQELRVDDGRPSRLRFRGVLQGVVPGDLFALAGIPDVGGELTLRVGEADLSPDGIARLVASGQCADMSLTALTQAAGHGAMTGKLRARIDDLRIEDNRLQALDAVLSVEDATGSPNWVETRLVTLLVERVLRTKLPAVVTGNLPERIEYTKLGVRMQVRDEELHLFGTHGQRERTILTVRLFGAPLPLVQEPTGSIDLKPLLDWLRARMAEELGRVSSLSNR
jgi:hypothetical protein